MQSPFQDSFLYLLCYLLETSVKEHTIFTVKSGFFPQLQYRTAQLSSHLDIRNSIVERCAVNKVSFYEFVSGTEQEL